MIKKQRFHGFTASSTYYQVEDVWHSDFCEPYEWNTEREMRLDMLIHGLAEDDEEKKLFESWDCYDEIEFFDRYDEYNHRIKQDECHQYDD